MPLIPHRFLYLVFALVMVSVLSWSPDKTRNDTTEIQWHTFNEALELSKTHPLKLFMDVYTPWCGWCKEMDRKTFGNKKIARYMNAHFYCVKFNAEGMDTIRLNGATIVNTPPTNGRNHTHPFASTLLDGKLGYPSLVFLDEQGKRLQFVQSFLKPADFEPFMHYFAEEAYKTKSFDQYFQEFKSE